MADDYGVPTDTTDATPRAGHLAPAINATGYALNDLSARVSEVKTTADYAKSTADAAKAKGESHDSRLDSLGERVDGVADDVRVLQQTVANPVPRGGRTGQVLKKRSNNDFDLVWAADIQGQAGPGGGVPAGGEAGFVLTKDTGLDGDVSWQKPKGGGGGGYLGTVVSANGSLVSVNYTKEGALVTTYASVPLGVGVGAGDNVSILERTDGGLPFIVGVVARANPYNPPVFGPMTVSSPYRLDGLAYPFSHSLPVTRDNGASLGMGVETFVQGTKYFDPQNSVSGQLPTPPAGVSTTHGVSAGGRIYLSPGGSAVTIITRWSEAAQAWETITLPSGDGATHTHPFLFVVGGVVKLVRHTQTNPVGLWVYALDPVTLTWTLEWSGSTDRAATLGTGIGQVKLTANHLAIYNTSATSGVPYGFLRVNLTTGVITTVQNNSSAGSTAGEAFAAGDLGGDGSLWVPGRPADLWSRTTRYYITRYYPTGETAVTQWAPNSGDYSISSDTLGQWLTVRAHAGDQVLIAGTCYRTPNPSTPDTVGSYAYQAAIWATDGLTSAVVWTSSYVSNSGTLSGWPRAYRPELAPEGGNRFLWTLNYSTFSYLYDGSL
ncbi:hypothetical protein [Blastococcus mobilis]|uniref:Uncharacterized protein n=1 Tax=Blastococcus mobilis TaxID=1938746 RepID=A0A238VX75_9ACTN|nr:hypothetical protein [Blastococcus mobilis]SNR38781.1 hypothetical protein SAMN06272737_105122 [Blastococcus mobilis]